jgi:hypothetical protein
MEMVVKSLTKNGGSVSGMVERELVGGGNVLHWEERYLIFSGNEKEDRRHPKMLILCFLPDEEKPYLAVIVDRDERRYEYSRWAGCCCCWVSTGELCDCDEEFRQRRNQQ